MPISMLGGLKQSHADPANRNKQFQDIGCHINTSDLLFEGLGIGFGAL